MLRQDPYNGGKQFGSGPLFGNVWGRQQAVKVILQDLHLALKSDGLETRGFSASMAARGLWEVTHD